MAEYSLSQDLLFPEESEESRIEGGTRGYTSERVIDHSSLLALHGWDLIICLLPVVRWLSTPLVRTSSSHKSQKSLTQKE